MSLGFTDFSVLTRRSNVGKVAEAVVELLKANAQMVAFLGVAGSPESAQVYRTTGLVPDRQPPYVVVRPLQEARVLQLNREAEVALPIAIGLVWDESRDVLDSGQKGLEEFFNLTAEILVANYDLHGTTAGGAPALVEGIDSFQPLDLIPVKQTEEGITFFQDLIVNYRYRADAQTGVKT